MNRIVAILALITVAFLSTPTLASDHLYDCTWSAQAIYRHDKEPRKVGGRETITAGSEGSARMIMRQLASRQLGGGARLVGELRIKCREVSDR